jgi:hypothetical protein
MNDIAIEMTDSLDRSGKGGMLAPLKFVDGTVGLPGISFANEPSTGFYRIGASQLGISVGGALKAQFNAGNIEFFQPISAPLNNTSLTIAGVGTGSNPDALVQTNTSNKIGLRFTSASTGEILSFIDGNAGNREWQIRTGIAGTGILDIFDATAAKSVLQFGVTDLATANTPVTIANTTANIYGLTITAPSTAGQSLGAVISAGTNASDYGLFVQNQAASLTYFTVRGDGNTQIYDRSSGPVDAGYKSAPQITTAVNRTCIASDAGKSILCTATLTITLNSAVFNTGDIVIIVAGPTFTVTVSGSATITWANGANTTGSRTITGTGVMSVYWKDASNAYVSGSGVS